MRRPQTFGALITMLITGLTPLGTAQACEAVELRVDDAHPTAELLRGQGAPLATRTGAAAPCAPPEPERDRRARLATTTPDALRELPDDVYNAPKRLRGMMIEVLDEELAAPNLPNAQRHAEWTDNARRKAREAGDKTRRRIGEIANRAKQHFRERIRERRREE